MEVKPRRSCFYPKFRIKRDRQEQTCLSLRLPHGFYPKFRTKQQHTGLIGQHRAVQRSIKQCKAVPSKAKQHQTVQSDNTKQSRSALFEQGFAPSLG